MSIASVSEIHVSTARRNPSRVSVLTDLTTGSLTFVRDDRLGYHDEQKGLSFRTKREIFPLTFIFCRRNYKNSHGSFAPACADESECVRRQARGDPAASYSDFTSYTLGWKTPAIGCWKENILTKDRRDIPVPFRKNNFLNLFPL
jgi:hypothetical protein